MTTHKALIETLPLIANYGGVLQAFAMQRLLLQRGVLSVTNSTDHLQLTLRSALGPLKHAVRGLSADKAVTVFMKNARAHNLRTFVGSHVRLAPPVPREKVHPSFVDGVTYGVAGSDQIWRPAYTDVWRNLFDFPGGDQLRKITYAGSFGVDDLSEFSAADRARFGLLLRKFKAVSVREISAQALLADEFGIESTVVLDPTLVVDPNVWHDMAGTAPVSATGPYLAYMVLDRRGDLTAAVDARAEADRLEVLDFYPPPITSRSAFKADPERFILPTVPEWLRTLRDAELVVTDSFHVCVFSMIFGTPFICLKNQSRGATRFDSLAKLLGIEGAFVTEPEEIVRPEFGRVDDGRYERIRDMRAVSAQFLDEALEH